MKKRLVSFVLTVSLLISVLAITPITVGAASGTCGSNLTWTLDDKGVLTISGTGDMYDYDGNYIASWATNADKIFTVVIENGVTSIGNSAFSGCANLTEIQIPYGVGTIGDSAFVMCQNLTSVNIPSSVTTIGDSAFLGCFNLKRLNIPYGVTTIGDSAFYWCGIENIVFPDSVTTIGSDLFYDSQLKTFKLSKGISVIPNNAFNFCHNLTNVVIPDHITEIGKEAFFACSSLRSVTIPKSVKKIGAYAFGDNGIGYQIKNIFYSGSKNEWNSIDIGEGNELLLEAKISTKELIAVEVRDMETERIIPNAKVRVHYNYTDDGVLLRKCDGTVKYDITFPISFVDVENLGEYRFAGPYSINKAPDNGKLVLYAYIPSDPKYEYDEEDIITTAGNSLNLKNNSFASFDALEDTLRGPKITILNKTFHLFEFPIKMSVKTPLGSVTYNSKEEKYEIMLGKLDKTVLANANEKNKTYHEIKEFVNCCGKSTSTDTWNRYQHLRKVLKSDNMSFGFSFNATPAGYMEFDKNGKLLEGAIVYVLNMDANLKQPIPAVPIVYVKVGLGVDATGKFGIKSIETNAYSIFGSLGLDIAPYVGVSVEALGLAKAEGGAKLKLKTQLELIKNKNLNEIFSASVTGQLYLKIKALPFINFDKTWDMASMSLYPDFGMSLMSVAETYDDMVIMPRDYANNESEFVANNNISLFGLDNVDTSTFKTNIYPYAEPQLIKLANGNELLVWIDNDNSRSDINCTVLKYSVNNGSSWSTPADIYNNGTADFSPKLAITDNGAVLVWQKANDVLEDTTTLPEMAKNIDIYYSAFDGTLWTTPINLSNTEDTYEFAPDIAVCGDEITTSWITNSDNDCFAFSGTNTIHTKTFNGSWGENTVVATDLGSVANLNVSYIDGKSAITYTEDTDDNIETSDDVELFEIYEGQLTQITDDEVIDYDLTKTSDGYYWIHNNQLWERNINGVELVEIPILPVYLNNAKILSNGSDKVIVYEQANEYSSDLYAMYYDSDDKTWGEPVRLTEDNKKIRETSGYLTTDGALRLAFGQANIDESAEDIYGECNLMLANITEKSDVQVISANCVYNEYVADEESTVYVNVKNNSSSKISKFNIKMTTNNETVISQNIETELLSGETHAIEIPYILPNDLTNKTYKVTVTPTEKTDDDLSNNVATFEMGFADIKVDTSVSNKTITATISNIGCLDAENVICTLSKTDGTVIETKTLNSISAGRSTSVQFTNVTDDSAVISITTDNEENLYANNTVSVILKKTEDKGVYIALAEYTADKEKVKIRATIANDFDVPKDVNVYVAFYKQGKLIDLQPAPITLTKNSSQVINKEISSKENVDTVKIFVWKADNSISPYKESVVLNITYPD